MISTPFGAPCGSFFISLSGSRAPKTATDYIDIALHCSKRFPHLPKRAGACNMTSSYLPYLLFFKTLLLVDWLFGHHDAVVVGVQPGSRPEGHAGEGHHAVGVRRMQAFLALAWVDPERLHPDRLDREFLGVAHAA